MQQLSYLLHKCGLAIVLAVSVLTVNGQAIEYSISGKEAVASTKSTVPNRSVSETPDGTLKLNYEFPSFTLLAADMYVNGYQLVQIQGFGLLAKYGAPALPFRNENILIPSNSTPRITITSSDFIELSNYSIMPAQIIPSDGEPAKKSPIYFDVNVYNKDTFYPGSVASIASIQKMQGSSIAQLQITPVQYNPLTKKIRIYKSISFTVDFPQQKTLVQKSTELDDMDDSYGYNPILANTILNTVAYNQAKSSGLEKTSSQIIPAKGYLIVTTPKFQAAADTLAEWRRQTGYQVDILVQPSWQISEIKNAVQSKYNASNPKLSYLLIIGDQEDVPDYDYWNNLVQIPVHIYSTNYYACMDGVNDFVPEMAHGRISAKSSVQAVDIVKKIIKYERTPPLDPTFYQKGLHAGYFQDSTPRDGMADKRYFHTNYEVTEYMDGLGYQTDKIFYTEPEVVPTKFNPYYSGNVPFPSKYLKSNGYKWNGGAQDILNDWNDGRFYVFHRDHGLIHGWVQPKFDTIDANGLHNNDEVPVVFSVNCSSGMFQKSNTIVCFSEKLLRMKNGGAVGIVSASDETRSGYNDAFIIGMMDAIWPSPGLYPKFGTGGERNPPPLPQTPIYTMGDIMIQGLIRMRQTWDSTGWADKDHFNLYHYFGDPATPIYTSEPTQITATVPHSIPKGSTTLNITNANCPDGIATVVYNRQLKGKIQMVDGAGTFTFIEPLENGISDLTVTISKHNRRPFITKVHISSAPAANFSLSTQSTCPYNEIELMDNSTGTITSREWKITPSNFSFVNGTNKYSVNPVIEIGVSGEYLVMLIVRNSNGADSITKSITILSMPPTPIANDKSLCGTGSVILSASGSTGNYKWWSDGEMGQLLGSGPNFQTPIISQSADYYVQAISNLVQSSLVTPLNGANANNGIMFDLTALSNISIDGFGIHLPDITLREVKVYTKNGTYKGFETSPAAWTLLGTYNVSGNGLGALSSLNIDPFELNSGQKKGIYIVVSNGQLKYTYGQQDYSNADLSLDNGAGILGSFGTAYTDRTFNGTVYFSNGENACNSDLVEVSVEVKPVPSKLTITNKQLCEGNSNSAFTTTGTNVNWYNDSLKTNQIATGTSYIPQVQQPGTYQYFADQNLNGCYSPISVVYLTILALPTPPLATIQSICFTDPIPTLSTQGSSIKWYSDSLKTTLLHNGSDYLPTQLQLGINKFYVSQSVSGCESKTVGKKLVKKSQVAALQTQESFICYNAAIPTLNTSGSNVKWYADSLKQNLVSTGANYQPAQVNTGLSKWFITQTVDNCQSQTAKVKLTRYAIPVNPIVTDYTFCSTNENAILSAGGNALKWYTGAGGSTFINSGTDYTIDLNVAGETKYYISNTENSCEGPKFPIQVNIKQTPESPVVDDFEVCISDTIYLSATGENLNWYMGSENPEWKGLGNQIKLTGFTPDEYTMGITQTVEGCIGKADTVKLVVYSLPILDQVIDVKACVKDENVIIGETDEEGQKSIWYKNNTLTDTIFVGSPLSVDNLSEGVTNYYHTLEINHCISNTQTATLNVSKNPDVKLVAADSVTFMGDTLNLTCKTAGDHTWSDGSHGNEFNIIASDFGLGSHYIWLEVTNDDGCSSADTIKLMVKNPTGIQPTSSGYLLVYPNPTRGNLYIETNIGNANSSHLNIYSSNGQLVYYERLEGGNKDKIAIDLSDRAPGIYILKLQSDSEIYTATIVKE